MADADSIAARAASQKAYRAANKDKQREYMRAYLERNPEKVKAAAKAHYEANTEAYKARAKRWAEANPKRRYEVMAKWRAEHPEIYREARRQDQSKHRAKRVAASKQYREQNLDRFQEMQAAWRAANPHVNAHHVGLRRTRKLQATPAWTDLKAVKAIYKRAAEMNRTTGQRWHVDHEIPLKHPLVCGLHNEFNLRVIPASENQSKRNKFAVI